MTSAFAVSRKAARVKVSVVIAVLCGLCLLAGWFLHARAARNATLAAASKKRKKAAHDSAQAVHHAIRGRR